MTEARVEIILPVYNSPHLVRPCIESILRWTDLTVDRLTVIDDGSDSYTAGVVAALLDGVAGAQVLTNPHNLGFVRTVNRGLVQSNALYSLLLNSDTAVTPRWTDKIASAMASDPSIGVSSPISNFAPHMRIDMLPGLGYLEMNALIEDLSDQLRPDITTPEGFCYAISRPCLESIGYFDVVFDDGYGEESDYAMRANAAGFRTVCVDDTYIFHQGRGTFGDERRTALYERNKHIFHARWGERYRRDYEDMQRRDPLGALRHRLAAVHTARAASAFTR